jgi:hypothetical protein
VVSCARVEYSTYYPKIKGSNCFTRCERENAGKPIRK